jgi:hypothetical protein
MISAALLALAISSSPASIVAPKPGADCVTYDGAYERAPLMKVIAPTGARVRFQDTAEPCQNGAGCRWVRAGYVAPGDVVFASAPINGFRCVYAGSRGKLSAGFVPDASLTPADEGRPITPAWLVGRWANFGDLILVSSRNGRLEAKGEAIWPGRGVAGPPGPNFGDFEGTPIISGTAVVVASGVCRVEAHRRGPYLVVSDNQQCGGMNVNFSGIYVSGSSLKFEGY